METKVKSTTDEFRTRVFWRWNDYQQRVKNGGTVEANEGVTAHHLDSVDLFLRGHLCGEYNLRFLNTEIRQLLDLFKIIHKSTQDAYEDVFWLIVDAYRDMIELELYEMIPALKTALAKITANHFPNVALLVFPEDPQADHVDSLIIAYQWDKVKDPATTQPARPIDIVLKDHNPDRCYERAIADNLPLSAQKLCSYIDDIDLAFRVYLMNPSSNLRRFYREVARFEKAFPAVDIKRVITAAIDEDLKGQLLNNEIWEVMPRFNEGWKKIKERYDL
ncbi:hypothetical protein [Larkinella punicea]|uniref:Uncharacterized protein n=1 Tax=Larkinella punicea TaxID=2315727 RepID=A0A368JKW1_9BACT|nr:hypothetical protein [Larkinella punicea]RCR68297.1 hypothetical protein DUE52_18045 [Larkinella punicea]